MSENWQRLSALVVGFGSIGRRHARVLKEIGLADVRVAEPADALRETARTEFAAERVYETLEDGLSEKPDTVFLCSPTGLHVPQADAAVRAGCDVFTEKPLSTSLDGIDALEVLAAERGRIVMVGHCFRFHDGLRKAKGWLDEGQIGRLLGVRCVFGEYIPDAMPRYRDMYISKYSGAYELMHDIDIALWFAGQEPKRVFGLDGTIGDAEMTSPDFVEIIMEFEDRRTASVHLDFYERVRHRQTELFGTEGTITAEFARWDVCELAIYTAGSGTWRREVLKTDRDDMFREEDSVFLRAAASRTSVPVDIREGKRAVEVMLAAQESSRTGRALFKP